MIVSAANIYVVPCGNRRGVILELETDAGVTGIGEAGIAYGAGTMASAEMLREMVQRFVVGRDPGPVELLWHTIYDNGFWTKGGGAICFAALSAIDHALWDIKARALGVPVHSLFGGPFVESLETYANGWWMGCDTPQEYAAAAARTATRGFRGLKLYPLGVADPVMIVKHPVRRSVERAREQLIVERCEAVREAVGPDVEIMLDFGGGLTMDLLVPLIARLEPLGICFIEEPVDPALPDVFSTVAGKTHIPLAAGERFYGRSGFHKAFCAGGLSIAQPDICNTGGFSEGLKIAAAAELHNIRVAPHNYGSPLATAIAAQFAAAIPNFMVLEAFPDFEVEPGYNPVVSAPLERTIREGEMPVPAGPGLGVTLDRDAVAPHRWATVGL
ncbi:mandelate racemase/muconate lactonizing enzyme family protein [Mesorhizobium sp. ZMM04-5]|uniref:Mandelate racemase/muconate lactonizing enzyme family protein n=1 Tax=Mesorhizobium marinum TaxID=3228790 RepID=A0ABV3R0A6_9HYPH